MDEFWVCAHCKSLNRAGSGKCYSCREKYGSEPPPVETLRSPGAVPPPMPVAPGQLTDYGSQRGQLPSSFNRPVSLRPGGAAPQPVRAPTEPAHIPNPFSAIRNRIARSLAMRQSVPVAPIGYLTCALLVVMLVIGTILVMSVFPVGTYLLQHANLSDAWAQLSTGEQELAKKLAIAFSVSGALTLLVFSIFVGLSTHNATGLGAGQPLLAPGRATTCWTGLIWAQVRIAVGLLAPAGLLWEGYLIPGLIAGIVALEIAHRRLDDGGGWLERPARHLADLYAKLGTDSSVASPTGSVWLQCFRAANWMVICVAAIPAVGFAVYSLSNLAGRREIIGWSSSGIGVGQLIVGVIVAATVALSIASIALLVPLSFGLVQRQRTRKMLVRVGRARSWVARPGEGAYGHQGPGGPGGPAEPAPAHYGGYEDDDRIVERLPAAETGAPGGPGTAAPGFSGPGGFGGPGMAASGFNGPAFGRQAPPAPPTGPVYEDPRLAGGSGPSDPGFGGPHPGSGPGRIG